MIKLALKQTLFVITLSKALFLYIYSRDYGIFLFSERKRCFVMIRCGLLSYQASNIFQIKV